MLSSTKNKIVAKQPTEEIKWNTEKYSMNLKRVKDEEKKTENK